MLHRSLDLTSFAIIEFKSKISGIDEARSK
ncbi:hypothetical protein [Staphylococcus aureus]